LENLHYSHMYYAGNKFIPTVNMKNLAGKEKWIIAPVNTKGVISFFTFDHVFIIF
jgi:hypothetical protein